MIKLPFALLALILAASISVQAAEKDTTSTPDADEAVVTLTTDTFDKFVNEHEYSLVEFYAPWCGHCKKLAPEYEAAAKELKGKIPLAKVDATVETDLSSKFNVQGYPTIKAFRKGVAEDYKGGRTKDTIIQYIEKMTGPSIHVAETESALEESYVGHPVAFIGKFKSKDSPAFKTFDAVAATSRTFGKFIATFGADNKDEMVVYREDEGLSDPLPIGNEEALTKTCDVERFPYFGPVSAANFADYFETKRTLVWFAGTEKDFQSAAKEVRNTAKQFRGEYNFVWLNSEDFKDYAENVLGVKEFPGLVVQASEGRYMFPDTKFDSSTKLTQFMNDVVAGKIEKSLMSDDIPETNDEPVKIVVGKTFNEIVQQKDKDVMLEVYAPWCGHCKKLEPIYAEFAEAMKDNKHLVIAKMDGTKNESPNSEFKWSGFPTIFFVKAGSNKPEMFDGPRTLEGLTEYVKEHSSKPLDLEDLKDEL